MLPGSGKDSAAYGWSDLGGDCSVISTRNERIAAKAAPTGGSAGYFFQVSFSVTVRLNTGAPSRESWRSATK